MARFADSDKTGSDDELDQPRVRSKRKHKSPKIRHTVLVARNPLPTGKEALKRLSSSLAIAAFFAIPLIITLRFLHGTRMPVDELTETRSMATASNSDGSTVRIMMVGDVIVHQGVWESGASEDGSYNYDHLFANISDDLVESDLALINQETILGGTEFYGGLTGSPRFNSPQEIGDAEAKAGFNVVLKANDHVMDKGAEGLTSELTFWRDKHPDTKVIGAVMPGETTAAESANPSIVSIGEVTVAILNYTGSLGGFYDSGDSVAEIEEYRMQADIEFARENADIVVVCPHWGVEGETVPNDAQRAYADLMTSWGVDIIFGCGPQVLQPVEILSRDDGHQTLCFWSIGTFVSTNYDAGWLVGGIAKATISHDDQGVRVTDYGLIPTVTHRGYGKDMTTYKLHDYTKEIAATNAWEFDNTEVTRKWVRDWCKGVLGNRFDTSTLELHGAMNQPSSEPVDDEEQATEEVPGEEEAQEVSDEVAEQTPPAEEGSEQ